MKMCLSLGEYLKRYFRHDRRSLIVVRAVGNWQFYHDADWLLSRDELLSKYYGQSVRNTRTDNNTISIFLD